MGPSLRYSVRYSLAKLWFSGYWGVRWLCGTHPARGFRILLMHDVSRAQMPAFERLLRCVLDLHGIVTPEEAEELLKGKGPLMSDGRIPYLFTFDDGFKSNFLLAREILGRYGVKAVFFVCPGLVDIPRERQRKAIAMHIFDGNMRACDLTDEMGLMSWSDLNALITLGHTIGSHTLHHRRLSRLSVREKHQEISESAKLLTGKLGIPVKWFAYPFGDTQSIDQESLKIIGNEYAFCCSGIRGMNYESTYPLALFRESVDLASPFEYQKLVVDGGLDFYYGTRATRLQRMAVHTVLEQR